MTYSCALFSEADSDLSTAQLQKLDFHIKNSGVEKTNRVLDIGCGWGSCIQRLTEHYKVSKAVGLTLSKAQQDHIKSFNNPNIECRLESWTDHNSNKPYDAIISIGALEHFVKPGHSSDQRIKIYRDFFKKCHELLKSNGSMSLQSIFYNTGYYIPNTAASNIFPESDLPRLCEITAATERLFSIEELVNHSSDYAKTLKARIERLKKNKIQAIETAGEKTYENFINYLYVSKKGFELDVFGLSRIRLKKVKPVY